MRRVSEGGRKRERKGRRGGTGDLLPLPNPQMENKRQRKNTVLSVSCEALDSVFARDKNKMCGTDAGVAAGVAN